MAIRPDRPVRTALLGAAFLMATSAIGPGFLTSTALFTAQLQADFGFAILISIVVDLVAQIIIWRTVTAAGVPAQQVANQVLPGMGHLLSLMIILGGLVFNIGNIAGCGLGLQVLLGWDLNVGAALSAALCMVLFLSKEAGRAMDNFAKILGFTMIALTLYVALTAKPPMIAAVTHTFWPTQVNWAIILTIVGGTVGGYITFAGAHRLLEAGVTGADRRAAVDRSAGTAIGVAALMRYLLFLAALGVVSLGAVIDPGNPAASVFQQAAGVWGARLFGLVIWAAAVTSVVGASFTSVSFAQHLHPMAQQWKSRLIIGFIAFSTILFVLFGKPVKVLIFAGAFNGLILALSLGIMLWAVRKHPALAQRPPVPPGLWWAGVVVAVGLLYVGGKAVLGI